MITQEQIDLYIEEHLAEEYFRVCQMDYFSAMNIYSIDTCKKEWESIKSNKTSTSSPIIKRFHNSLYFANRKGCPSPYYGWEHLKNDIKLFEGLLRNRLKYVKSIDINNPIPLYIYAGGLNITKIAPTVSYFKPWLAKYLTEKYLSDCETIFDPFSGYSGRMLGVMAANKRYIGRDISTTQILESQIISEFIESIDSTVKAPILEQGDIRKYKVNAEPWGVLTCPPYGDIEEYPESDNKNISCDEWIDIVLKNVRCNKYVFVVDDKIDKYKDYIVEIITNKSHFGSNDEYVVVI